MNQPASRAQVHRALLNAFDKANGTTEQRVETVCGLFTADRHHKVRALLGDALVKRGDISYPDLAQVPDSVPEWMTGA